MTATVWTEDRIGRLKALWLEGRTAEQIASDLAHGVTRSAVLGKVYRMGLSAGRAARENTTRAPVRRTKAAGPSLRSAPEPAQGAPERVPEGLATLLSVGRDQCRWPCGDPKAATLSLCGRPVGRGAFCGAHAALAYRPRPDTPRSLERLARLN